MSVGAGEVLTLPVSIAVDPVELKRTITKIDIKIAATIDGSPIEIKQETRFFGG